MTQNERQYEAVAKFLDGQAERRDEQTGRAGGESVRLDASAEALAGEIRALERGVGKALDVAMPALVLERVRQQMMAELERQALRSVKPARSFVRRLIFVGGAMAAAAGITLAVWAGFGLLAQKPANVAVPVAIVPNVSNSIDKPIDLAKMDPAEPKMDLLARQIDEMSVEMIASPTGNHLDVEIGAAEQALQSFYDNPVAPPLEDAPPR